MNTNPQMFFDESQYKLVDCDLETKSILKPAKVRAPLQEVDLGLDNHIDHDVIRKRRVSFAGVNKIKEFNSKAESIIIFSTPAYEETFSTSSDSSVLTASILTSGSTVVSSPALDDCTILNDTMDLTDILPDTASNNLMDTITVDKPFVAHPSKGSNLQTPEVFLKNIDPNLQRNDLLRINQPLVVNKLLGNLDPPVNPRPVIDPTKLLVNELLEESKVDMAEDMSLVGDETNINPESKYMKQMGVTPIMCNNILSELKSEPITSFKIAEELDNGQKVENLLISGKPLEEMHKIGDKNVALGEVDILQFEKNSPSFPVNANFVNSIMEFTEALPGNFASLNKKPEIIQKELVNPCNNQPQKNMPQHGLFQNKPNSGIISNDSLNMEFTEAIPKKLGNPLNSYPQKDSTFKVSQCDFGKSKPNLLAINNESFSMDFTEALPNKLENPLKNQPQRNITFMVSQNESRQSGPTAFVSSKKYSVNMECTEAILNKLENPLNSCPQRDLTFKVCQSELGKNEHNSVLTSKNDSFSMELTEAIPIKLGNPFNRSPQRDLTFKVCQSDLKNIPNSVISSNDTSLNMEFTQAIPNKLVNPLNIHPQRDLTFKVCQNELKNEPNAVLFSNDRSLNMEFTEAIPNNLRSPLQSNPERDLHMEFTEAIPNKLGNPFNCNPQRDLTFKVCQSELKNMPNSSNDTSLNMEFTQAIPNKLVNPLNSHPQRDFTFKVCQNALKNEPNAVLFSNDCSLNMEFTEAIPNKLRCPLQSKPERDLPIEVDQGESRNTQPLGVIPSNNDSLNMEFTEAIPNKLRCPLQSKPERDLPIELDQGESKNTQPLGVIPSNNDSLNMECTEGIPYKSRSQLHNNRRSIQVGQGESRNTQPFGVISSNDDSLNMEFTEAIPNKLESSPNNHLQRELTFDVCQTELRKNVSSAVTSSNNDSLNMDFTEAIPNKLGIPLAIHPQRDSGIDISEAELIKNEPNVLPSSNTDSMSMALTQAIPNKVGHPLNSLSQRESMSEICGDELSKNDANTAPSNNDSFNMDFTEALPNKLGNPLNNNLQRKLSFEVSHDEIGQNHLNAVTSSNNDSLQIEFPEAFPNKLKNPVNSHLQRDLPFENFEDNSIKSNQNVVTASNVGSLNMNFTEAVPKSEENNLNNHPLRNIYIDDCQEDSRKHYPNAVSLNMELIEAVPKNAGSSLNSHPQKNFVPSKKYTNAPTSCIESLNMEFTEAIPKGEENNLNSHPPRNISIDNSQEDSRKNYPNAVSLNMELTEAVPKNAGNPLNSNLQKNFDPRKNYPNASTSCIESLNMEFTEAIPKNQGNLLSCHLQRELTFETCQDEIRKSELNVVTSSRDELLNMEFTEAIQNKLTIEIPQNIQPQVVSKESINQFEHALAIVNKNKMNSSVSTNYRSFNMEFTESFPGKNYADVRDQLSFQKITEGNNCIKNPNRFETPNLLDASPRMDFTEALQPQISKNNIQNPLKNDNLLFEDIAINSDIQIEEKSKKSMTDEIPTKSMEFIPLSPSNKTSKTSLMKLPSPPVSKEYHLPLHQEEIVSSKMTHIEIRTAPQMDTSRVKELPIVPFMMTEVRNSEDNDISEIDISQCKDLKNSSIELPNCPEIPIEVIKTIPEEVDKNVPDNKSIKEAANAPNIEIITEVTVMCSGSDATVKEDQKSPSKQKNMKECCAKRKDWELIKRNIAFMSGIKFVFLSRILWKYSLPWPLDIVIRIPFTEASLTTPIMTTLKTTHLNDPIALLTDTCMKRQLNVILSENWLNTTCKTINELLIAIKLIEEEFKNLEPLIESVKFIWLKIPFKIIYGRIEFRICSLRHRHIIHVTLSTKNYKNLTGKDIDVKNINREISPQKIKDLFDSFEPNKERLMNFIRGIHTLCEQETPRLRR